MFESIIRFGTSEEVKLLNHNADEIRISILAFKPSIVDGIYISESAIKEHARFLFGRPVTAGPVNGRAGAGNAIGQVDEMPRVLDNGQIVTKATLWPRKLSEDQIGAVKASRQVPGSMCFLNVYGAPGRLLAGHEISFQGCRIRVGFCCSGDPICKGPCSSQN